MRHKLLIFLISVMTPLTLLLFQDRTSTAQGDTTFDSPLLTPPAPPAPTPTFSAEAWKALQYVSEREGIPLESLLVVNDYERGYPLVGRTFQAITILDIRTIEGQTYDLLIDLADGRIEDDWNAVEAAEEAAYQTKYGKLHPSLYERLGEVGDDDRLLVAVWLAPNPNIRTREEVYAELAARYPEAALSMEREEMPWTVDDPALAQEIRGEYRRMRAEDTAVRVESLVNHLSERDFTVKTYGAMPSVSAFLPKKAILELVERDDVGVIYLTDALLSNEMDTAVPTDRVSAVWRQGIDGTGVNIAILESGKIDPNVNCLNIIAARNTGIGVNEHKTLMTSVAACNDSTYTGVAPGVGIIDAGYVFDAGGWPSGGSQENAVAALQWAIQTQNAPIVNASIGTWQDNNLNWIDRAFDYWAREEAVVIATSAGNNIDGTGRLTSPGKAWNVITVGGFNDKDTPDWSDDEMWQGSPGSAYVNPVGTHREKPEVVAPSVGITMIGPGNVPIPAPADGTSLAAPQVAGLAALLIDRNSQLAHYPMAVKAIIMASAVHNVFGPKDIPTGAELRDGAGAIDAALADQIAQVQAGSATICNAPCWWSVLTTNSSPVLGGSLYRYFNASKGERIRVAISWWSNADPPLSYPDLARDVLDTNYDLYVYAPSGSRVDYTASRDNNYELVDFVAPETGRYKIRVYRSSTGDNSEASNRLGIAWVKDATYLPDLRNKDGWNSELYVRNDSNDAGALRRVQIHYFDANGNPNPVGSEGYDVCILGPNERCWIPVNDLNRIPGGTSGSATVSGGEDVSVIVHTRRNNELTIYSGVTASSGPPGWEQTAATLYAPLLKNNHYGRSSRLYVTNAGASATIVRLYYYNAQGTRYGPYSSSLDPNQTKSFSPSCGATLCSARITNTAGQPLAAVVFECGSGNSQPTTYNVFGSGDTTNYVPIFKNDYYGQTSAITVMNVGSGETQINTIFYDAQDDDVYIVGPVTVKRWASHVFYQPTGLPSGFLGSARVVSNGQPIVSLVAEGGSDKKKSSGGFVAGTASVYVPNIRNESSSAYYAALNIQNLHTADTTVDISYYRANGTPRSTASRSIAPYEMVSLNYWDGGMPDSFAGSVTLISRDGRPIVVLVNQGDPGSGDTQAAFNGANR